MCCLFCQIFRAIYVAFFFALLLITFPLRFILDALSGKYTNTWSGTILTIGLAYPMFTYFVFYICYGEGQYYIADFNQGLKQGFAEGVYYVTNVYYGMHASFQEWEWGKEDAEKMIKAIQFY